MNNFLLFNNFQDAEDAQAEILNLYQSSIPDEFSIYKSTTLRWDNPIETLNGKFAISCPSDEILQQAELPDYEITQTLELAIVE